MTGLEGTLNRAVWLHIRQTPKLHLEMIKAAKIGVVEMFEVLYPKPQPAEDSVEELFVDICMTSLDLLWLRAKLRAHTHTPTTKE